ncbi:PDZ domain-containing protein [Ureibacillus manganicus]|uniref:Cell division protein MinJ n=1 Tax=Ureibacillus manganicus DSM 26584 TaxID=1384049 RepID=A0A0A3ICN6_9BACL|nr:PDZ domain-containing protein [Ureibacillus manganicus]KGR80583.1 cell division protein MinJ [Ureibacillus manganicus DSM 26584]
MIDILYEFLRAVGRVFVNPILYLTLLMAVYVGYRRVKNERRHFHIRILSGWAEVKGLVSESLLFSLCISVLSLLIGLTLPVELLYIVTIVSILSLLTFFFHLLSPIIYVAISVLALLIIGWQNWSFNVLGIEFNGLAINDGFALTITVIVGLLLIAEGLLIRKKGAQYASPRFEQTKRGLKAVSFFSKKFWVLPIFFIVPGDAIQSFLPYWPQFTLGSNEFSIILFPIVIGYQQMARKTLPVYLYPKLGRTVLILGQIVVIGGLFAYFMPIIGLIVLFGGAVLRLMISFNYTLKERKDVYAVSQKSNGVMIAAILPVSPAEKMGLKAGEVIRKVNGVDVQTKQELYEALQINAAHCKLEVLDHKDELRLTQQVVYSKDHHQIGLIVAE